MEFFAVVQAQADEKSLQKRLTIENLPVFCGSIHQLIESQGNRGKVFCVWGEFMVHRENINGGVRFVMPHCPNALAWTVTTGHPPDPGTVVVHCTINREEHEADFIETIETFVEDWKKGIEEHV